ncbi:ankyrin repeat and fibronectin type-III domain-containing protein 1-like [Acipenser ruthenus]|uniref:ankyrin repeat and fibronectin type-III domain-containing protein 1-like n=1 Tax=Acipenser ruthenus TaxID=7906 RepID=UPI00274070AA|nr:ankyrin repeat and fibronectin type-III domain-containing protein 1-like [Acipenser ruthenus]
MALSLRDPPQRRRSLGPISPKRLYRNLSVRLRGGASIDQSQPSTTRKVDSGRHNRKSAASYLSLFDAVENEDTQAVHLMLSSAGLLKEDLNGLSSEGLVPMDVAVLTSNTPLVRILSQAGARDNPHLTSTEERGSHLSGLVLEAGRRVLELTREVKKGLQTEEEEGSQKRRELRVWTLRLQLYTRMRDNYQSTVAPGPPSNVAIQVTSETSLMVTFREPTSGPNSGIITQYKVEWSCNESFNPLCGWETVHDLRVLQFSITGLTPGLRYFVQVFAYNVKGWGPAQNSSPPSAVPSSWKECCSVIRRRREQERAVTKLLEQVEEPQYRGFFIETSKVLAPSKSLSVSRSLKQLFHSANKFARCLQRGVYLATVFYHKDNILVTAEEQIPLVEIDSCSTSVMQELNWFVKLSCAWKDVQWLQQGMASALSSSSSVLQTRQKILLAVSQLQSALGTADLGQVYYEPLRDQQGNMLLLTLHPYPLPQPPAPLHWTSLASFQRSQRKSSMATGLLQELTAIDTLAAQLKEKLAYHRRSTQTTPPGLYLGFLKLYSSVEQKIQVLVPQKLPNLLCHCRVRENKHVSRVEWEWLQALSSQNQPVDLRSCPPQTPPSVFVRELRAAVIQLLTQLSIPLAKALDYRLYTQEVLQFGDSVSFLLLLPHPEDIWSAPGQHGRVNGFLTLPLHIFELVHFSAYESEFYSRYCQASVLLELDSKLSQQALREALDKREAQRAKERHTQVMVLSQRLEELWREVRWITDALHWYRQGCCGAPLHCFMEASVHTDAGVKPDPALDCPPPAPSSSEFSQGPDSPHSSSEEDEVFWPLCGSDSDSPPQPRSSRSQVPSQYYSLRRPGKEPCRGARLPERSLVEWINGPQDS